MWEPRPRGSVTGVNTVAVVTHPFGATNPQPLTILEATGARVLLNPLGRKPRPDELRAFLAECGASAVVAGTERYDAETLDALPGLRLIARTGVGLDGIDLEAARARGVAVSWTPEGPSDSAAELAVGLLLALARDVPRADRDVRAGRWLRRTGWLLRTRTVGILGLGRIGQRVARILRGFGGALLACDIDPGVAPAAAALGVELVPFAELLARADALTLHVPLTPLTRGLLSADALARLRRGALLVNTARGELIDEAALLAALERGQLGGAALDVFHEEPYAGPLAARDDVLLTCHMGSCTDTGRLAMETGAARAVAAWLAGQDVPDRVV